MTKLAIFNLPDDTREKDIDELFGKYGELKRVALRQGKNAMMCFIEYDDLRDAETALERRHEYDFKGSVIRVELSHGGGPPGGGRGRDRGDSRRRGGGGGRDSRRRGGGGGRDNSRGRDGGGGGRGGGRRDSRRRPAPAREFKLNPMWHKIKVSNMPMGASWQDMKDFFRPAGNVKYTDAQGDGTGVAGFATRDEADRIIDKLDGEDFRARDGEKSRVKLVYESGPDEGDRSRSRGSRRGGSRSRSPSKSRSRSR